MSIKSKSTQSTIQIDLTGPQGNAFYLIGTASKLAKKLDFDEERIISEMTEGNYENLIKVFDKYFGSFVTLYR
jgi:hypothetical protein